MATTRHSARIRNRDEEVQVIADGDAAAINVQQGSRWRRLLSTGKCNGPINSD